MSIALLRWYGANQTTSFSVGSGPSAVAFDGANIWVTNFGNYLDLGTTVTKLQANNGAILGTYTVGVAPTAIAFDGANIWVGNGAGSTVTKLRASDGTVLGSYSVGNSPSGLAFDGANIWVTCLETSLVYKL
jgi:hypothetical protein